MSNENLNKFQETNDVFSEHSDEVKLKTKKMMVYIFMFAVVMIFAGLTSGYIVKMGGEYWVHINPPTTFYIGIVFLVLSSLTIFFATKFIKTGNKTGSTIALLLTLALGIGFTYTQLDGWKELREKGMGFTVSKDKLGHKSYRWNHLNEITGEYGVDYYIHKDGEELIRKNGEFYLAADHLLTTPVTGKVHRDSNNASAFLIVLIVAHIVHLVLGLIYILVNTIRVTKGVINRNNYISLRINSIYWHFMGILWVYLFVFLFLFH